MKLEKTKFSTRLVSTPSTRRNITLLTLVFLLFSPVLFMMGCNKQISDYVSHLTYKEKLNPVEHAFVYTAFNSMWVVGYPLYPEAAEILEHYLHGDGTEKVISNSYIKTSPFIKELIKEKGVGTHVIGFKQHKDWRLSYALNPFRLQVKKNGEVNIYQWIHFPENKRIAVRLNIFGRELRVNDALIHKLNPKAFMLKVEPWHHKRG